MSNLFKGEPGQAIDKFEVFWKKFPRDPVNKSRKSGKTLARRIWKRDKLDEQFDHIMAVIKEDAKDIKNGVYSFCPNSSDRMHYYKGIIPWLHQRVYDRELQPEPPAPLKPVAGPVMDSKPVTKEYLAELRKRYLGGAGATVADVVDGDKNVVRKTSYEVK